MNMTIKELQATCDDLYYKFVYRLSHVTDFETVDKGDHNTVRLYTDKNHNDYMSITKWNNGDIWIWVYAVHGLNDVRVNKVFSLKRDFKRYTSTISDKPLNQKKRAILLELNTKLKTLLKDYL